VLGCSGYVTRGRALYADGRYIEAAEVFERTEHRLLSDSTPSECARYGLYRGLTLLTLGDARNAHRWLAYAYNVERARPGSLDEDERSLLDDGWTKLSQTLRSAEAPSSTDSSVAARGAPPAGKPRHVGDMPEQVPR
jgi:tetratricopeptide (TPR) repeat protein